MILINNDFNTTMVPPIDIIDSILFITNVRQDKIINEFDYSNLNLIIYIKAICINGITFKQNDKIKCPNCTKDKYNELLKLDKRTNAIMITDSDIDIDKIIYNSSFRYDIYLLYIGKKKIIKKFELTVNTIPKNLTLDTIGSVDNTDFGKLIEDINNPNKSVTNVILIPTGQNDPKNVPNKNTIPVPNSSVQNKDIASILNSYDVTNPNNVAYIIIIACMILCSLCICSSSIMLLTR